MFSPRTAPKVLPRESREFANPCASEKKVLSLWIGKNNHSSVDVPHIVGLMLKEGLDVYMPLVDDDTIDAVVKKPDGNFVEVQISRRASFQERRANSLTRVRV